MGGGEGDPTVSLSDTSEMAVRPASLGLSKGESPLFTASGEGVELVAAVKVIEVVLETSTLLLSLKRSAIAGALGIFGILAPGLLTMLYTAGALGLLDMASLLLLELSAIRDVALGFFESPTLGLLAFEGGAGGTLFWTEGEG